MPYYANSMPKLHLTVIICFAFAIFVLLCLITTETITVNMTTAKTGMERSQKCRARKKAQNPTMMLSHMQMIDLKMKERFNEQRKLAYRDPLYQRALSQEPKIPGDPELDGYSHLGPMNVQCERGCEQSFSKMNSIA